MPNQVGTPMEFPAEMDNHQRLKAVLAEIDAPDDNPEFDSFTLLLQAANLAAHLVDSLVGVVFAFDERISRLERAILPLDATDTDES